MSKTSTNNLEKTPKTFLGELSPCRRTTNGVAIVAMVYSHTLHQIDKMSFKQIFK
jgi:hypothetical protein